MKIIIKINNIKMKMTYRKMKQYKRIQRNNKMNMYKMSRIISNKMNLKKFKKKNLKKKQKKLLDNDINFILIIYE